MIILESGILLEIWRVVLGVLTLHWLLSAALTAYVGRWNDCLYSLSILCIMWSGLDLLTGIVCVSGAIWVHAAMARREGGT
jgi:hypothetical protein